MAQENESLEFGQVLKDSDTGWEQVESIGSMRKEFGDASFCYSVNRHGIKYLEIFERPLSESVIFEVDDENQVLRIVSAIEGTDKWRTDEPPVGDLIEIKHGDSIHRGCYDPDLVWNGVSDPDNNVFVPIFDVTAWRPYNPANWEVNE